MHDKRGKDLGHGPWHSLLRWVIMHLYWLHFRLLEEKEEKLIFYFPFFIVNEEVKEIEKNITLFFLFGGQNLLSELVDICRGN